MVACFSVYPFAPLFWPFAGVRFVGVDGFVLIATAVVAALVWRAATTAPPVPITEPTTLPPRAGARSERDRWSVRTPGATLARENVRRIPGIAVGLLATGLVVAELGLRLLARSGGIAAGLVVAICGVATIVWLDRIASPTEVEGANARPVSGFWPTLLPRAGGNLRWVLTGVPLLATLLVWRMMRARGLEESHADIALLWLISILATVIAVVWPVHRPHVATWRRIAAARGPILVVSAITVLAAALRLWHPADYPRTFSGDEGSFALAAREVLSGRIHNPFGTGWLAHPSLFFYLQAGSLWLFGDDVAGIRILSGLIGVAAVVAVVLYARQMFGWLEAVIAGALLATFHHHVFVSRTALNNVGDTLFLPLSLWLIDRGIFGRRRLESLLAGVAIGGSQYFYPGSRLLPVIALALLGVGLVFDRETPIASLSGRARDLAPYVALMLVGALVILMPFLAFYVDHTADANARVNAVSIFASGWLRAEEIRTGHGAVAIIAERIREALLLAFHGNVGGFYRPSPPFIGAAMVLPVAVGMGIVAAGCWKRRYAGLAISFVGAACALALTEGFPFQSNRFSGAVPLFCLFAAVGFGAIVRIAVRLGRVPGSIVLGIVALTIGMIGAWNVNYFFHDDNQVALYSDPNTQVANTLAYELQGMPPGVEVYFFGPPRMWYDGFTNIAFIAPDATGITVEQPWTASEAPPVIQGPTLFVALPERGGELELVRGWFPGGVSREVTDETGQVLYVEYRVGMS